MIVVSDTSPVLNLARIGRLELLPLLYRQVLIPSAVYEELTFYKHDLPTMIDLASAPWLIVAPAQDRNRVQELREDLDPGEAEAIVLAIERGADLLLVDERRGRRTATAAAPSSPCPPLPPINQPPESRFVGHLKPFIDNIGQTVTWPAEDCRGTRGCFATYS